MCVCLYTYTYTYFREEYYICICIPSQCARTTQKAKGVLPMAGGGLELDDLEGLTQLQPICDMLFQQVIHVCERDLILTFFSFSKTENEMELLNAGMPPQAGIARIASGIRERVKRGSDYSKNDSL